MAINKPQRKFGLMEPNFNWMNWTGPGDGEHDYSGWGGGPGKGGDGAVKAGVGEFWKAFQGVTWSDRHALEAIDTDPAVYQAWRAKLAEFQGIPNYPSTEAAAYAYDGPEPEMSLSLGFTVMGGSTAEDTWPMLSFSRLPKEGADERKTQFLTVGPTMIFYNGWGETDRVKLKAKVIARLKELMIIKGGANDNLTYEHLYDAEFQFIALMSDHDAIAGMADHTARMYRDGVVLVYHHWSDIRRDSVNLISLRKQTAVRLQAESAAILARARVDEIESLEDADEITKNIAGIARVGAPQSMASPKPADIAESPDEVAQMHALHQQGFLMRGLSIPGLIDGYSDHKKRGTTVAAGSKSKRKLHGAFSAISVIEPDPPGGKITNPLHIKNILTARSSAHHFLSLTNTQLSALVPTIRLFRVNYKLAEKNGEPTDTLPPTINSENPETEFYFHTHYDADNIGVLTDSITSSRFGRGAGVGLKEFVWSDKATSPGDKGKRFEASLTLHFQSLDDLITHQSARAGDMNENPPSFLNLVVPPHFKVTDKNEGKKVNSQDKYNGEFFQIRAIVGWSVPNKNFHGSSGLNFTKEQIKAIENTRQTFFLQLNRHTFNFNDDGTIELQVEYFAAEEGMLDSAALNLFYISEDQVLAKTKSVHHKKSEETVETLERKIKTAKQTQDLRKQRDLDEKIKALKTKARKVLVSEQHSWIVRKMQQDGAMRSIRVKPSAVGMFKMAEAGFGGDVIMWKQRVTKKSDEDMLAAFKGIKEKDTLLCGGTAIKTEDFTSDEYSAEELRAAYEDLPTEDLKKSWISRAATAVGTTLGTGVEMLSNLFDPRLSPFLLPGNRPSNEDKAGECIEFEYFFLGDLIDAACAKLLKGSAVSEKFKKSMFHNKLSVVLGPITYVNPFATDKDGNLKTETISLADVPISFMLFQLWWQKTIIDTGTTSFTLKQFLEGVVGQLISPAIGPDAFGEVGKGNVGAARGFPSITLFNYPKKVITAGKRYNISSLKGKFGTGALTSDNNEFYSVDKSHYYMYIHYISRNVRDMKGCYDFDMENGIYHLAIGRDRGIVKSIQFKRTDYPGVKEHAMTRDENLGYENLREPYDADVELIGNTLFQNGDLVFLNPLTVGSGAGALQSRSDIMSRLLIGGYYVVVEVEHTISQEGFSVSFSAKSQGEFMYNAKCPDE